MLGRDERLDGRLGLRAALPSRASKRRQLPEATWLNPILPSQHMRNTCEQNTRKGARRTSQLRDSAGVSPASLLGMSLARKQAERS